MAETIKLNYITKVEGHAELDIRTNGKDIEKVQLKIVEGARFFEGLLIGMQAKRAPVVASRICGVCSHAHLLAAYMAIENAYNLKVSEQTTKLRKLLLYSSIIQSHSLHLFFMSMPDYLGYQNAVTLAKNEPEIVKLALKLKMLANRVLELIGGREVHAVTTRFLGFKKVPRQEEIKDLLNLLKSEESGIIESFRKLFLNLKSPELESDCDHLSVMGKEYGSIEGKIKTLKGKQFGVEDYKDYLTESVKEYSSSKYIRMLHSTIMTSALSRINLKSNLLNEVGKGFLSELKLKIPNRNPFSNNVCQAVEILNFYEETIRILENLVIIDESRPEFIINKYGVGVSAIEVPRGILFHEFRINTSGYITGCNIITPTTQNVESIENDIIKFLPTILDKDKLYIQDYIERLIRAYDPCISCSTHFLKINWK